MTVKEMRIQRNMTQEALAEAAGCSRITIARMEAGRTPVTMKIMHGLSRAFGVSVNEVLEMLEETEANSTGKVGDDR